MCIRDRTYSVSKYQTGAGASDVFAHTLERYFFRNHCALGDSFAEGLLRTTVTYGPIAVREPEDYESHAELMLCGAFSHNDITHIGHSGSRGGPHSLESQLSGRFDTTHGAGLAVIMPAWLQGLVDMGGEEAVLRVAQLAINVFGVTVDTSDMKAVANEGIERFRKDVYKRQATTLGIRLLGMQERRCSTASVRMASNMPRTACVWSPS